jgi:hypothetical protein
MKILAAASIAFLRKISGITPCWNDHLEKMQGLK